MEKGFRSALGELRRQAVRPKEPDPTEETVAQLEDVMGLQIIAKERGLSIENVRKIEALQREKQRIMDWLRARLKGIDALETEYEPGARRIVADKQGDFFWEKTDGTREPVGLGALLTDGIWDVNYALDPETVPRQVRKKFYIEKARRLLQRELDRQIAIDQSHSALSNPRNRQGYRGLVMDKEVLGTQGHLAERMVFSFLNKLSIDEDVPFTIEAANVYEDIELKIDFILKVRARKRGVAVEGVEEGEERTIGVQFTIASRRSRKLGKLKAAKEKAKETGSKVEDIILVKIPLKRLTELFAVWSANKPPGGPDDLWDPAIKQKIIRGMLKGMLEEEEIEAVCAKVAPQNPFVGPAAG